MCREAIPVDVPLFGEATRLSLARQGLVAGDLRACHGMARSHRSGERRAIGTLRYPASVIGRFPRSVFTECARRKGHAEEASAHAVRRIASRRHPVTRTRAKASITQVAGDVGVLVTPASALRTARRR